LLEDNPLKAKKRNPKNDLNTMPAEMRVMEENFCKSITRIPIIDRSVSATADSWIQSFAVVYDHTAMARKCEFSSDIAPNRKSVKMLGG